MKDSCFLARRRPSGVHSFGGSLRREGAPLPSPRVSITKSFKLSRAKDPQLRAQRAFVSVLIGLTSLVGACGGDDSRARPGPLPGPSPGPDPFVCAVVDNYELHMLADFERGEASDFYTNSDGSRGSTTDPPPGSKSPVAASIEGGRCGVSSYAYRMTGESLSGWGMVFGFNFRDGPEDLSEWEGVAFWVRRKGSSGRSLFFSVFDPGTDPKGGKCDDTTEVLTEKCDTYGAGVGLEEEWRFVVLPFAELSQRGFGFSTEHLIVEQIYGLNWAAGPGDWDLWIDDIALFRLKDGGNGGEGGGFP